MFSWLQSKQANARKDSLLIVDDDPLMKRLIEATFPGWRIAVATSTEGAKAELLREPPSVVICDCLLGAGNSGIDLYDYCAREFPRLPFLMISGLSSEKIQNLRSTDRRSANRSAGPQFLKKPFFGRDLRSRVERILAGTASQPSSA